MTAVVAASMTFRKKLVFAVIVGYAVLMTGAFLLVCHVPSVEDAYPNVRSGLFTGFMTAGSFLLSAYAFLVLRLKESIYDSSFHHTRVIAARRQIRENNAANPEKKPTPMPRYYEELRSFSFALWLAVTLAFVASVSQFTFGMVKQSWSTALAVGLAFGALLPLSIAVWLASTNVQAWIRTMEAEKEKQLTLEDEEDTLQHKAD